MKKCVYLALTLFFLLSPCEGGKGADTVLYFWEKVFTQDLAVPPNKVF